ncbi:MAG: hypothetical protein HQL48_05875 [Gammaproteobacteria bacterium]|nr:hypothetical protein [Gammaproteobacteria bacterium]
MEADLLQQRLSILLPQLTTILDAMAREVAAVAFAPDSLRILPHTSAEFRLEKDPSSGEYGVAGEWREGHGLKVGTLIFNSDGSFFVEQDIVLQHPTKPQWFVEAVTAWGRGERVQTELRLIPMVR